MNRADMPLSSRDIEECSILLFGRIPDALTVNRWVNAPIRALLTEILASPEFQSQVLSPALLREALPHQRFAPMPPMRLLDWVQRRLPVEPPLRAAAAAATGWVALLDIILSDAGFISLSPVLAKAGIDRLFRERRLKEPHGMVTRAVIGSIDAASALEVRGWAIDLCDKTTPVTLELFADHLFIGSIQCVDMRADVKEAVGGNGQCGFSFRVPTSRRELFADGRQLIALDAASHDPVGVSTPVAADVAHGLDVLNATRKELVALRDILLRIERRLPDLSRLASVPLQAYAEYFDRFYRLAEDARAEQRRASAAFVYAPLISVIMPTWNSDAVFLDVAIDSVRAQTYGSWELIVTDDASVPNDTVREMLRRHQADPRIRCLVSETRGGIAENTNRALAEARGDYVVFLDHDDAFSPDALFEVVRALQEHRYRLVYSDEDRIEEGGLGRLVHHSPFFKPDFDPELLRSMNYVCHLVAVQRELVGTIGGLRAGFEGAQDHDFLLRLTERLEPRDIRHIARILYHWRVVPQSASGTAAHADNIRDHIAAAVQQHLERMGWDAVAEAHADSLGANRLFATRVRWRLPAKAPVVSIIVPTRDRLDLLRPCLDSLLRTAPFYPGTLDLVVVDNDSVEVATQRYFAELAGRVRVVPFRGEFNWSAINNAAARTALGDVLIFLNNDTVVLTDDWCVELVANALRADVGAVGARLLYDDGTLQHAGVVLGVEGVAGHDSVGESPEKGGYYGRSHLQRSAAAVTGACLATRRDLFKRLGGFDEIHLKVAYNDIDYCLRVLDAGYRVVYDPYAVLYHYESKSRGYDLSEAKLARQRSEASVFRARWAPIVDNDPYYNSHFERFSRPFDRLRAPPERP